MLGIQFKEDEKLYIPLSIALRIFVLASPLHFNMSPLHKVRLFQQFAGPGFMLLRYKTAGAIYISSDRMFKTDSIFDSIFPQYIQGILQVAHIVWLIWTHIMPSSH